MDERLAGQFDWTQKKPTPLQLCIMAILIAREDRAQPSQGTSDEELNPYLAHILSFWFQPIPMSEIVNGDFLGILEKLNQSYLTPQERQRRAQMIGDHFLFFTSQHERVGRASRYSISMDSMIGVGSHAYSVAAANTRIRKGECRQQIFSSLSKQWPRFQSLLDTAGDILGYDQEIERLVVSGRLVVTLEDVLEARSVYDHNPTTANWDRFADLVHRREWTDGGFHAYLPLRPQA